MSVTTDSTKAAIAVQTEGASEKIIKLLMSENKSLKHRNAQAHLIHVELMTAHKTNAANAAIKHHNDLHNLQNQVRVLTALLSNAQEKIRVKEMVEQEREEERAKEMKKLIYQRLEVGGSIQELLKRFRHLLDQEAGLRDAYHQLQSRNSKLKEKLHATEVLVQGLAQQVEFDQEMRILLEQEIEILEEERITRDEDSKGKQAREGWDNDDEEVDHSKSSVLELELKLEEVESLELEETDVCNSDLFSWSWSLDPLPNYLE